MFQRTSLRVTSAAVLAALGLFLFADLSGAQTSGSAPDGRAVDAAQIATSRIKDLRTTMVVVDSETNKEELEKIGGSFKPEYFFKRMNIAYKQPGKVRLEAKVIGLDAILIFDGNTRRAKAAFKKDVKDLTGQPGQKQSLRDFGIFAKDWTTTDWEPVYMRREGNLVVFRLNQRNTDNKSHDIAWVNPKTSVIERRQQFSGDNKLRQEVRYLNVKEARPGIWVPSRIEIWNQYGKRGGVQVLENTLVNNGVDDKVFQL